MVGFLIDFIKNPGKQIDTVRVALNGYGTFKEVFIEQQYLWLLNQFRPHTTVLDIGAHLGDTAAYFAASKDVDNVFGYEPVPIFAHEALLNKNLSPFRDKIKIINKAVTHDGKSRAIPSNYGGFNFLSLPLDRRGQQIDSLTLAEILEGNIYGAISPNLRSLKNVAIKSDCEGAEKFFFKEADLSEVYAIECECHDDVYAYVSSILSKKRFRVTGKVLHHQKGSQLKMLYAVKQ